MKTSGINRPVSFSGLFSRLGAISILLPLLVVPSLVPQRKGKRSNFWASILFVSDLSKIFLEGYPLFRPLILRGPRVFYRAMEISGMITLEGRYEYLFNRMLACSNAGVYLCRSSHSKLLSHSKGVEGAQTPMHGRYDALYPLSSRLISHRFRWTFDKRW